MCFAREMLLSIVKVMRIKGIFYFGITSLSKLNPRLTGNLLYLRNVEKIT